MRRITQTLLGPGDGYPHSGLVPGNCMQAAIASMLDLDLAAVPHFALFEDWRRALHMWARPYGWDTLSLGEGPHVQGWTLTGGARLDRADLPDPLLLLGTSPRGTDHAVVGTRYKRCVWDPHPSRVGLSEVRWFVPFLPVETSS
jgi:hypothetical protein